MMTATAQSARYAVIGNPVAHSKSPQIHTWFAAQTGQDMQYECLLAPLDGFKPTVLSFFHEGGLGANVTVPFKLEAHRLADSLSARARAAGAVNTLQFAAGKIYGDNTDGVGLVIDIVRNAAVPLVGQRVLVMGAGGAARGVLQPLLAQQPASIVIANRTPGKAIELANLFSSSGSTVSAAAYDELEGKFDIVINATSASLASQLPALNPDRFATDGFAYDMMYGQEPTVFMQFAQAHGVRTRDGLGMLIEQAAESFFFWRGVRPPTAALFEHLRK